MVRFVKTDSGFSKFSDTSVFWFGKKGYLITKIIFFQKVKGLHQIKTKRNVKYYIWYYKRKYS